MKLLKFFFLALCSVVMIGCTSDEPDNPDNGEVISPDTQVADPTGTVLLSMRDSNNGKTYLGNFYIENENFSCYYALNCNFVDLGPVNGLGNVSYIPKEGWAKKVMVVPGHGYVAYDNGKYYRIYVIDYAYSTLGGIIGADIKYQFPFYGANEEIILDKNEIILKKSKAEINTGGIQYLYRPELKILNQVGVDVDCQFASNVYKLAECSFLWESTISSINNLKFWIDLRYPLFESLNSYTEIGTITLTTGYGKSKTVKVFFDPENQVDTNIDTTGKKFIYLVGSITGWTTPSEENASFYEDYKLYDLEDNGIYTGTFYIGDGGGIFRFYKTLTGWQGGSSYGSQEADIPVDVVFNNGVYIGPATAGKGSWNISNGWSGGNLSISVDTNNNLVTFSAL